MMSMAFFAFIFSALFALLVTIFNDYSDCGWLQKRSVRTASKIVVFCGLFYFVMANAWVHNHLLICWGR